MRTEQVYMFITQCRNQERERERDDWQRWKIQLAKHMEEHKPFYRNINKIAHSEKSNHFYWIFIEWIRLRISRKNWLKRNDAPKWDIECIEMLWFADRRNMLWWRKQKSIPKKKWKKENETPARYWITSLCTSFIGLILLIDGTLWHCAMCLVDGATATASSYVHNLCFFLFIVR